VVGSFRVFKSLCNLFLLIHPVIAECDAKQMLHLPWEKVILDKNYTPL